MQVSTGMQRRAHYAAAVKEGIAYPGGGGCGGDTLTLTALAESGDVQVAADVR